ncbi:ammonium transporter [Pelagicoccus sp. SDUM812003]|uniref:ammonium transporter n=1 Tax=Pelagicoccus sp. SDUM812003 TaxID=3041267 RepID=UPI0028104EC8|nr:ammonium transporter [Pelagicoccus sp. SDUM812003]MDQ8204263.1 ammonium transporter [Pelagicoccus sp. SDUM812003]
MKRFSAFAATVVALALPSLVHAQEQASLNAGDTAWMIVATALVLFMTLPGLSLFYGGLVRAKNVLSILMQCFAICAVMSLLWVIFGYSLAVTGTGPFIGGLEFAFLKHLTVDSLSGTIPESVFVTFQMTFAIITPALIVGAFAERIKFSAVMLFSIGWFVLSYIPIWHMAWSEHGFFHNWSVMDFAGGTVVHINAAMAGLVGCLMVGRRKGAFAEPIKPHSLPLTVVGASMLWVGWFGFNAGSAVAADGTAGMAMLVTQIACATSAVVWMLIEWLKHGKASVLGIATGAVAGLVAITPASGNAGPMGAILIGAASSVCCYLVAVKLKFALKIDDSLDVFGVHGIGGIVGAILTGVVASESFGGTGYGEGITMLAQVWGQFVSVVITIVWSGVVSLILFFLIDKAIGLRVDNDSELKGLDLSEHDEQGYEM